MVHSLAALDKWRRAPENAKHAANVAHCAGFSLGEYTALVAAGIVSFEDGVRLVKARAEAMHVASEQTHGAMASVAGMDEAALETLMAEARTQTKQRVQIANYLFAKGVSISGDHDAVKYVSDNAEKRGALKSRMLFVSGAFHTDDMAPAKEAIRQTMETIEFKWTDKVKVRCPVAVARVLRGLFRFCLAYTVCCFCPH